MTQGKYDEFFENSELIQKLNSWDLNPQEPCILDQVCELYSHDIVAERHNVKTLFLACISSFLPTQYRIHCVIQSQTGAGKSYLLTKVTQPFRALDIVKEMTNFSESWLKREASTLDRHILLFQQVTSTDDKGKATIGMLKFSLSEESLSFGISERNKDGKWEPVVIQSHGLPVLLTSSTRAMNEEDANRMFLLSIDESEEQTAKIMQYSAMKASSSRSQEVIRESVERLKFLVQFYQKSAKEIKGIMIPYAPQITESMPKSVTMRRDFKKILQLIRLITFIHWSNRKRVKVKRKTTVLKGIDFANPNDNNPVEEKEVYDTYIISQPEDYLEALQIGNEVFKQTILGLPSGSIKLLEVIKERTKGEDKLSPSIMDLQQELNKSRTTLLGYIQPLKENGFIESIRLQGERAYRYKPTGKDFNPLPHVQIEFDNEKFLEWFRTEYDGKAEYLIPKNESLKS